MKRSKSPNTITNKKNQSVKDDLSNSVNEQQSKKDSYKSSKFIPKENYLRPSLNILDIQYDRLKLPIKGKNYN